MHRMLLRVVVIVLTVPFIAIGFVSGFVCATTLAGVDYARRFFDWAAYGE